MKQMVAFLMVLLTLATMVSCQKQDEGIPELENLPEKSAQIISSDNQFGLELFRRVIEKADANDNTMISPLSISLALAMTYNGASGETKSEMEKVMKLHGLTTEQINRAHKALVSALQSADPDVLLEIANAIFYERRMTVRQEFVTINKEYYDAEVRGLDFTSPATLNIINGWVNDKTNGKIPTIIEQLEPDLRMILMNAIYFNGIWKYKFDPEGTHDLPFRLGDGSTRDVETMSMETSLEYSDNKLFSAVQLPYGKGDYQMTVLLPHEGKSTGDIIKAMSNNQWKEWMKEFRKEEKVVVHMPRFKFEWEMKLNQILTSMGMQKAFIPNGADFSEINGKLDLFIGYVIHKTYVDVNENGTEAAAVTAVGIFTTSMPVEQPKKIYFTVDRPFLFTITEQSTGTILFIGEINSPEYK